MYLTKHISMVVTVFARSTRQRTILDYAWAKLLVLYSMHCIAWYVISGVLSSSTARRGNDMHQSVEGQSIITMGHGRSKKEGCVCSLKGRKGVLTILYTVSGRLSCPLLLHLRRPTTLHTHTHALSPSLPNSHFPLSTGLHDLQVIDRAETIALL